MNVSGIPEVVPSTQATPAAVAAPGGAPALPGFDFAALFLAALGLAGVPTVPAAEAPDGSSGETPAPEGPSEAPNGGDDPNALSAAAAAAAALSGASPLLVPTAPADAPAEGEANAAPVPGPGGAANAPVPVLPPTGQQPAAESEALAADADVPETPANTATVAQATVPAAPLASGAPGVASTRPAGKTAAETPAVPEGTPSDTVEVASQKRVDATPDHPASEAAAGDADATADAKPAEATASAAGNVSAAAPEEHEEVGDGRAAERSSAAGKSAEATHGADVRTARADGERAGQGSEHHDGGRELGRRETVEATRSGGGPDPSAPSPLPPTTRETARVDGTIRPERLPVSTLPHEVERIIRLDAMRSNGGSDNGELRLELTTDGLGRVDVRVAVQADAVHASLFASHDHAREALEAHRPALEAALSRSNLRLEGFNVGLGQQGRDSGADLRDQTQGTAAPRSVPIAPPSGPTATGEPIKPTMAAGGLSLRA